MIQKLLFAVCVFFGVHSFGQAVCGTHSPTQAEFDYLLNTVANQAIVKNTGTTCIPIQLHVVRETNGTGGISISDIHKGVAYLNAYFFPAGIEFYFCGTGPNFINNSQFYDFQNSEESALAAAAGENNNAINMYFVDEIDNTGGPSFTAGYAYTPANSVQSTRIVLRNDNVADGATIVHEMGHHFALLHTFETSQFFVPGTGLVGGPELVDGSNCTTAGDIICDTPADPGFNGSNINPFTCQYNGTATDANNQLYTPAVDNVMSYYPSQCQNPFVLTPGQISRIQQGLAARQGHTAYDMSCPASNVTDPSGLTGSFVGATVVLNWTDNSTNETGFFIERSEVSATTGFEAFGEFGVGPNITTFTDNNINTSNTYFYRVKASNDACNDYSNVVQVGGVAPCSITAITAGTQSACDPTTNTYTQAVTITYSNAPGGTLNVNGQTFAVGTSPQNVTLTALPANGNNVSVTAFFTNETTCTFTNNNAFTAPTNCTPAPCSITAITAGTQSACDPTTNTYTQAVTITYSNAPGGTLNVNGQTFAVGTSPQNVILTSLPANGNNVSVTAFFTNETTCTFTNNNAFTAPASCAAAPCSITSIAAFAQGACDPNTNTYVQDLIIDYNNPPSGTINVNGQTFAQTGSPQIVSLTGLPANGNSVNATAFFTNQTTCTFTDSNTFTAPPSCATAPCSITAITAGTQSACDPTTNTYTQAVIITYSNAPGGTLDVNGQTFAVGTSPQNVTLTGLPANGNSVSVTAFFSNETTCTFTNSAAFTAPVSCASNCIVGDVNATLDGDTFNYCPGTVLNLLTDSTEVVPPGEVYAWVFQNATDTIFVNTGGSFSGDVNAAIVAGGGTPIPFGTYLVYALLTENSGTAICGLTPGDFVVNVLDSANAICLNAPTCSAGDVAPNLIGTTVDYCPGTNIELNTNGTEVILTSEDYLWVFVNATDTVFVNVGPSYIGDINADLIAAGGTAIPAGAYTVFGLTTSGGGTAICDVTLGDFTINVLAANDPACVNPCSINGITMGIQSPCDPASNTYSQEITISYANEPAGTINVNGQVFPITGSPQTVILTGLPADGLPVIAFAFFTNSTSCNYTENPAFTAPVSCAPGVCNITGVSLGVQTFCDSTTNTYSQDLIITYSNAPGGTINVNGQTFPVATSPQLVTLTGLPADGSSVDVFTFFTNETVCNFNLSNVFFAPSSCAPVGASDSLVVVMIPNGAGTLFVGSDVITSSPFTGYYPLNTLLDISAVPGTNDVFNFWRLNNQSLIDFSPSTDFLFNNQDTLYAYFNGAVSIDDFVDEFENFKVYPTLVEGQLTIEFTSLIKTDLKVEVFGLDGKLVQTLINGSFDSNQFVRNTFSLDLASGMYFIKGSTPKDAFTTRIIVK